MCRQLWFSHYRVFPLFCIASDVDVISWRSYLNSVASLYTIASAPQMAQNSTSSFYPCVGVGLWIYEFVSRLEEMLGWWEIAHWWSKIKVKYNTSQTTNSCFLCLVMDLDLCFVKRINWIKIKLPLHSLSLNARLQVSSHYMDRFCCRFRNDFIGVSG